MLKSSKIKHDSQDQLRDDIAKIKSLLSSTAFNMKDCASDILSDSVDIAKDKSKELKENIAEYAHKKPVRTLGISFLAGLCLGFLFKRR